MGKKVTKNQIERLILFMENNPLLQRGTLTDNFTVEDREDLWMQLQSEMHAIGGCQKSVDKWKECWSQLKTDVKRRFRIFENYRQETGGGPAPKPLADLDERVLALIRGFKVNESSIFPTANPSTSTHLGESEMFARPCTPLSATEEYPLYDSVVDDFPSQTSMAASSLSVLSSPAAIPQSEKRAASTPIDGLKWRKRRRTSKIVSPDKAEKLITTNRELNEALVGIKEALRERNIIEARKADLLEERNSIEQNKTEILHQILDLLSKKFT